MSIINTTVLKHVSDFLSGTPVRVEALPAGADNIDGFSARGLPTGSQIVTMPEWYVEDWHRGFGGQVVTSGRAVRYVRPRLSHRRLWEVMDRLNEEAAPDARGRRRDVRTREIEQAVLEGLEPEGFYLQDLWEQLAEVIALALLQVGSGRTNSQKFKGNNMVKRTVNEFMNSFQPVRGRIEDDNTNLTKFLQYTVRMGYPETGIPTGTSGFFRNAFVRHMVDRTDEDGGVRNLWGEGPFRAVVSCTGKTLAGEWVTMVPPMAFRLDEQGNEYEHHGLKTPLMIAGLCPIGFNAKRHFREMNAVARSWRILHPRPVERGTVNGFEYHRGPDLEARQTEVVIAVGGLVGINLYPDERNPGEYLNLDDIVMTPRGRQALKSEYRKRWDFTAEEWRLRANDFLLEDGSVREGYLLDPQVVRATSVNGRDVYTADMSVEGPVQPDPDTVGKVLVDGLKAMAKTIATHLIGVDAQGNEYPIDLVISGHSIREKKMPFIPLQAAASRAGIRYWKDFETPISPERLRRQPGEDYARWACRHDDLVRAAYLALISQGEEGDGTVDVYAITDTLDGSAPARVRVGRAVVGYVRASRLYESERTGTKVKKHESMPIGTYIRMLANLELKRNPEVLRQLNMMAELHNQLAGFGGDDDDGDDYDMDDPLERQLAEA